MLDKYVYIRTDLTYIAISSFRFWTIAAPRSFLKVRFFLMLIAINTHIHASQYVYIQADCTYIAISSSRFWTIAMTDTQVHLNLGEFTCLTPCLCHCMILMSVFTNHSVEGM